MARISSVCVFSFQECFSFSKGHAQKCVRGGGGVALSAARTPDEYIRKKQSVGWLPVKFLSGGTVIC